MITDDQYDKTWKEHHERLVNAARQARIPKKKKPRNVLTEPHPIVIIPILMGLLCLGLIAVFG